VPYLLTWLANGFANRCLDGSGLDGSGEDIADAKGVFAQHMRVDAQRHGWVGVAKPGGHDMYRDSGEEQRGRVQVAQIMQAGMGECLG
jgi:hypothetical protein